MKREKTNGTESVIVIVWTIDMWPINKSKKEMSLGLKKKWDIPWQAYEST